MATPDDIRVLEWPDAARKRPGMYIGDPSDPVHRLQLLWNLVGRALEEHLRGGVRSIDIAIDGARVTVEDDGAGLRPDVLESVLTPLHGPHDVPHAHLAPFWDGRWVPVTCALSSELVVETRTGGHAYAQRFERGRPVGALAHLGPAEGHGTRITFVPDDTVIAPLAWDGATLARTCRELAALAPGLVVTTDDGVICYPRGLADHAVHLAGAPLRVEPLHVREQSNDLTIDVAIACAPGRGRLCGFVNHATCTGSHLVGLREGLEDAFRDRAAKTDHVLALVHVTLDDPGYTNVLTVIRNPRVASVVRSVTASALRAHFEQAPAFLDAILLGR